MPRTTPSAISSGDASAHAINAFLPPSSSVSALSEALAACHHRAAGVDAADEADLRDLRMRDQRGARVASARHAR